MKKLLILAALAALALGACTKNEVVFDNNDVGDAVSFSVYTSRTVTKADATNVIGIDTLKKYGFGVFAFYTGQDNYASATHKTPNFMNNQMVKWDNTNSKWTYSPVKYWPNNSGDKVSFFAYAPYNSSMKWNADKPYIEFTVNEAVKGQVDQLFAAGLTNRVKNTATGIKIDSALQFKFNHALSKIGFEVAYVVDSIKVRTQDGKDIDSATKIVIDSINIAPKGTSIGFYKTGKLDMTKETAAKAWIPDSSYHSSFALKSATNFKTHQAGDTDKAAGQIVTSAYAQLNADDSYMMIIPQDFSEGTLYTNGIDITVRYHVWTKDTNLSSTAANQYSKITNKVTTNVKITFEAGKAYTLKLLLGMTSVKVSAEVADWPTPGATTVDLPVNQE